MWHASRMAPALQYSAAIIRRCVWRRSSSRATPRVEIRRAESEAARKAAAIIHTLEVLPLVPVTPIENQGSAQTVVEDARLLSVGEASALAPAATHNPSTAEALTKDTNARSTTENRGQRQNMRSAVLAVRDSDANRLMLAANAGVLRLALRPLNIGFDPNAALDKSAPAAKRSPLVKMSDLGHTPANSNNNQARNGRKLVIQEGRQERELTADKKDAP